MATTNTSYRGPAGVGAAAAKVAQPQQATASLAALETRCVDTVRVLANDCVERAGSGHPGAPIALAPLAHVLWTRPGLMRYDPADPAWPGRDRFVLSNGHACALLYSMLHLTGYAGVPMEELQRERRLDSVTPGHPESVLLPGAVEVTTGPLGQGVANAVGLAVAATRAAAEFNDANVQVAGGSGGSSGSGVAHPPPQLCDSHVWCVCGDGCMMEGVASEAASFAGHAGLGRLTLIYDANHTTIDGDTSLAFTEDVPARFEAYGWRVQVVGNGDTDLDGIEAALRAAKASTDRPSLVVLKTTNGFGSLRQGTHKVHDGPLGQEDTRHIKGVYGFSPDESFVVPPEVAAYYAAAGRRRGGEAHAAWRRTWDAYRAQRPDVAAEFARRYLDASKPLPAGWFQRLPRWTPDDKPEATRVFSGRVLEALHGALPELVGGSADLTASNKTNLAGAAPFTRDTPHGRYIHFGVREHAMAGIANGLAAFGGCIPFVGTFLNFFGYAAGAIRLSALSHTRVLYVGTHDSVGVGEDGPTHQPVEMLAMLRALPNMLVWRPADGNEVSAAYAAALLSADAPTVLALSRQAVPHLAGSSVEAALRGGYVLCELGGGGGGGGGTQQQPHLILLATGSEVHLAADAAARIVDSRPPGTVVRVVSLPCGDVFERQPPAYRAHVLPDGVPVLAVEAGSMRGWERYAHQVVGVSQFGVSAPHGDVYAKLGITVSAVTAKGAKMIEYYSSQPPGPAGAADVVDAGGAGGGRERHPVPPTLFVNAPVF